MPMKIEGGPFKARVEEALHNDFMRGAVRRAQDGLRGRKLAATNEDRDFEDWEAWRQAGEAVRRHTIENLDYYLEQLSENVEARGGHVFFAATAEEATAYIRQVVKAKDAKRIIKSKSMVTEEISLNAALEADGCEVVETDLGEYILQLDDHEPPSHLVAPAVHKNQAQIRELYAKKIGYTATEKPEEITAHTRKVLRETFLHADIGITGCNFAVAETGTVTLLTNEGNADLATSLPKTQISVMGMERLVPTWEDLDILVSLLSRSAVGQRLATYVTALTPGREEGSVDGPEDFHLVIVDAGRSKALGTEFQDVLHCIRCGACINVCPVYRHIGGHAYGSIYQGPIGAVLSPILGDSDAFKTLPFASSLCGACTEACPVGIPLHEQLVAHRRAIVEDHGEAPWFEKLAMRGFGAAAAKPERFARAGGTVRLAKPLARAWTAEREFPAPARTTFRKWFEERKGAGR
ncbi:MAG TPA: LutB/LldF family L-lactate oxidation iron-sulfur protein [Bacillales bacterium]|nr:LutB/LldF family L-lactate oxidation iron-sulfur protein [Bacillales bacterium]